LGDAAQTDRPWGRGNNPWTAVRAFLQRDDRFAVDASIEEKLLLTAAPGGYLLRVKD
jgi:cephalosporin hydroxylase